MTDERRGNPLAAALLVAGTALLAGCGTPRPGRTEAVQIAAEPPGATVQLSTGESCTSPCIANLLVAPDDHESAYVARLSAAGCQPLFLSILPYYGPPPHAAISIPYGAAYYLWPNPLRARLSCGG